jgi:NADPH2:quinone reductase
MKAAVVESWENPPRYAEFADPVAVEGELGVKVSAAGLHQVVRALASGQHYGNTGALPFVPGVDGVGQLADGQRVYFGAARPPFGTFAELCITRAWMCVPLPDALDDVTAAALANPAMSSRAGLMRAGFVAGESVLILGATGVAGQLAIQVARRLGAKAVTAAGRNPQALATLRGLGADQVIPLLQEESAQIEAYRAVIAEGGADVVLDYLWGRPAEVLLRAVAQKGLSHAAPRVRYVQLGNMAGATISLDAATLRSSGLELLGSGFGSASMDEIMKAVREMFVEAANKPFEFALKAVPLREIAAVWDGAHDRARLVFVP